MTSTKSSSYKINYLRSVPKDVYVAFSGGVDSMVLLHSLLSRKHNVSLLFIDHQNDYSDIEYEFAKQIALKYNLYLKLHAIDKFDKSNSLEAFWSRKRFEVFQSQDKPVVTGHHLDDAVEWYVMTSMQGCSKLIDFKSGNILRPMLTVKKEEIYNYANNHGLTYLTDPTNLDSSYNLRNNVRLNLMEPIKSCFPGIRTTVKKLITEKTNEYFKSKIQ